jgi:hypothetical protein
MASSCTLVLHYTGPNSLSGKNLSPPLWGGGGGDEKCKNWKYFEMKPEIGYHT